MATRSTIFKTAGFWIAALMVILQALNALRAFADPAGYADDMGLPLLNTGDVGFVYVYGLRAAFISILVSIFLIVRKFDALSWMALAALIMPIGDGLLAFNSGAPNTAVLRHAVIAVYVLIAFVVLRHTAASETKA